MHVELLDLILNTTCQMTQTSSNQEIRFSPKAVVIRQKETHDS